MPDPTELDNALAELVAAARVLALNQPRVTDGSSDSMCAYCMRYTFDAHAPDCEWHRLAVAVEALDEARRNQ